MNQPKTNPTTRGENDAKEGARARVLLLVGGVAVALLGAVWFARQHTRPPTQAGPPPPPPVQTTVAETTPPAPRYAPPVKHRDFSKRRGAPKRQAGVVPGATNAAPAATLEEVYGLHVCAVRFSMGEAYLDLRYQVLDPDKAARLSDGKTSACLLDSASGTKLLMPKPPAEGAFPPTSGRLASGRVYFAVIPNRGGVIKSGNKVELLVGGAAPTSITVQ